MSENGRSETLIPPRAITALAAVALGFALVHYFTQMRYQRAASGAEIFIALAALTLWVLVDTNKPLREHLLARPKEIDPAPLAPSAVFLWTVIYLGLLLLSPVLPAAILGRKAMESFHTRVLVKLCSLCLAGIAFIAVFVLYLTRKKIDRRAAIRLRFSSLDLELTVAMLLLCLPISAAVGWLSQLFSTFRGLPPPSQKLLNEIMLISDRYILFAFAVMAVAAVGPVVEEVVFRGLVFRSLRDRFGFPFALIASSLIFAGVHADPSFFLQQALLGAVLAVAYERTQSLTTPILIHCLNNLFTIGIAQFS